MVRGAGSEGLGHRAMKTDTLLHRQIHPQFFRHGRVMSPAFRPTAKDGGRLSVDDGDRITAEAAWRRHTTVRQLRSVGVLSVSVGECCAEDLTVEADPQPDAPEHVGIDYGAFTKSRRLALARRLTAKAEARGWQHGPVPA